MISLYCRLCLCVGVSLLGLFGPLACQEPAQAQSQSEGEGEARGETIRVATYNIEHLMAMYDQYLMPPRSQEDHELWADEEERYEVAQTMLSAEMNADIVGIQESCTQELLEALNREELHGTYEFVRVFPGNSEGQYVAMMAKPGFKALEVRDQYYLDTDPERDPGTRGQKSYNQLWKDNLLFGRGPGFVLFETPGGHRIWVGSTHIKSKYGNNASITRWRIRQMTRVRQIAGELVSEGKADKVIVLGDFNDNFGMDDPEKEIGADAVATMIRGEGPEKLLSLTKPLAEANPQLATFHSVFKPRRYRSFIDHIFVSPNLAEHAVETHVVDPPIAAVASDHYPVVSVLTLPPVAQATAD